MRPPLGGVIPIAVRDSAFAAAASGLRPGQVLQGTVQESSGGLLFQAGTLKVPLEPAPGLVPGLAVRVEVLQSEGGLQLRLLPQPPIPQSVADSGAALSSVLSAALRALGVANAADSAAALVPPNLAGNEAAVRFILSLFLARASIGGDLRHIAALVRQAAANGGIETSVADRFATFVARYLVSEATDLRRALEHHLRMSVRSAESRIAQAVASGQAGGLSQAMMEDVRQQLGALMALDGLRRFLRNHGRLAGFDQAVSRALDRASGGQLQNLRGLEQPYVFLELPFTPESSIQRAQIHIFGDGQGRKRAFDAKRTTVVLDISTTKLGDLWISLRLAANPGGTHSATGNPVGPRSVAGNLGGTRSVASPISCSCWFRATDAAVVSAIQDAAKELTQGLAEAGYPASDVRAALWDGDRLKETAQMMRRFAGIDVRT